MLGGGTAEQEEEECHLKSASTSLKDTFLPPGSYSGCVDAENERTPKNYSFCSFSKAFKHFDRNPFVCVHFEPPFLDKTKLCQTCLTAGVLVLNTAQFLFSLTHSVLNIFSYIYLHIICMRENDNIYY